MALKINIPFFAFRIQFYNTNRLTLPMTDSEVVLIGETLPVSARRFAESLQRNLISQGELSALMEEYRKGPFYKDKVEVAFPGSADRLLYPDFELYFDYFFQPIQAGAWAIVPSLGIELFVENAENLEQKLREHIRLDFVRKRRLSLVQHIVSSVWLEQVDLRQHLIELVVPSPREVQQLTEDATTELLPKVAQILSPKGKQVHGLKTELQQLWLAISDKFNRNALLVGPSGVGKTTLVWEVARRMSKKGMQTKIWETTASILIKELVKDTDWQDNIAFLCKELSKRGDFLFVRSLMELFEVGRYVGNEVSMAEYLRTFISNGEINLIVECTEEELARIELQSPNFAALFRMIRVNVPPEADLEQIIRQKTAGMSKMLSLPASDEAVTELIRLSRRFNPYSGMPGKPIRFLESLMLAHSQKQDEHPAKLERSNIVRAFCEESGLPVFMIDQSIPLQLEQIESFFRRNLFGQHKALGEVVNLMASVKTALNQTGKPIASLLFVGPTGVGKTEMAKLLAEFMFGHRDRMTRFDMSEFSDFLSVNRLINSEGLLTSAIRRAPFSVVLFDEVEKADSSFYDLLLQILSEGRLTDANGHTVNFCSSIIIMTSNLGAQKLQRPAIQLGQNDATANDDWEHRFLREVQLFFRPELYNRIDQVIPFRPLEASVFKAIVEREVDLTLQREGIRFRRMSMKVSNDLLEYLAREGYDPMYGARHLQRIIREKVIIPLAKTLNALDPSEQINVSVELSEGQPFIRVEEEPLSLELLIEELKKDNYAAIAGQYRKLWQNLSRGHLYVNALNELSILDKQRMEHQQMFWNNKTNVQKYHAIHVLIKKGEQLQNRIYHLENNICLASLGVEKYRPDVDNDLKEWFEQWEHFSLELLSKMEPQLNTCHIGLYSCGSFQEALDFYLNLMELQGLNFSAETVWYRESLYNEMVWAWTGPEDTGAYVKQKKEAYLKLPADLKQTPVPEQAGDILVGVELAVNGHCVYPFLSSESGIHEWPGSKKNRLLCLIEIHNGAFATPKNLHRMDVYRQTSPRRVVAPARIKDTLLDIDREYYKTPDLLNIIYAHLQSRFKAFVADAIN